MVQFHYVLVYHVFLESAFTKCLHTTTPPHQTQIYQTFYGLPVNGRYINAKTPCISTGGLALFKIGIDILSRALGQVPSAQAGLTSLFGMGRGDPRRNKRHKGIKKD